MLGKRVCTRCVLGLVKYFFLVNRAVIGFVFFKYFWDNSVCKRIRYDDMYFVNDHNDFLMMNNQSRNCFKNTNTLMFPNWNYVKKKENTTSNKNEPVLNSLLFQLVWRLAVSRKRVQPRSVPITLVQFACKLMTLVKKVQ